jgi:chemotaxis protein MotA
MWSVGAFLGFLAGILAIALSLALSAGSGGRAMVFFDPPAMAIVLGGVLASAFASFRPKDLLAALRAAKRAFEKRRIPLKDALEAAGAAGEAWRMGPSEMGPLLSKVKDPFFRTAISASAEMKGDRLVRSMEAELEVFALSRESGRDVWERLAHSADAWGSIGALAGFACALLFREDEILLKGSLFTALSSSLWGLAVSRLVMWPVWSRLKAADEADILFKRLAAEAAEAIQEGESQAGVKERLERLSKTLG